jgi:hypothetical protein
VIDLEAMEAEAEAKMAAAGVLNEKGLRDLPAVHPTTAEELATEIAALVNRPHSYGTCVYAMSLAAVATFNFVAGKLGVTGFQASCADLDIIARTRGLKCGLMIVDPSKLLYPQYDLVAEVQAFLASEGVRDNLRERARKLLEETNLSAAPAVLERWRELAK